MLQWYTQVARHLWLAFEIKLNTNCHTVIEKKNNSENCSSYLHRRNVWHQLWIAQRRAFECSREPSKNLDLPRASAFYSEYILSNRVCPIRKILWETNNYFETYSGNSLLLLTSTSIKYVVYSVYSDLGIWRSHQDSSSLICIVLSIRTNECSIISHSSAVCSIECGSKKLISCISGRKSHAPQSAQK